jgi:hypothetical protein
MQGLGALLVRRHGPTTDQESVIAAARVLAEDAPAIVERLCVCVSLEGGLAYVYLWCDGVAGISEGMLEMLRLRAEEVMPGGAIEAARLAPLQEVAGASAGREAPIHYAVETDVTPEWEKELASWYRDEHLPGLAAVPGCTGAWRLENLDGGPRSFACYDLLAADVLETQAWLAVRGTPWSDRVRPQFRNMRRAMFRKVYEGG